MAKKSIWVTGASGRLGSALVKMLKQDIENKVVATDMDVDITNLKDVTQHAEVYRPNIVINCASLSNGEYCENNKVEAYKVNALGARNLAIASHHVNAKIIHLSTDDIFEGKTEGSMTEFDIPAPVTIYAKSKLAGEEYVRELNPKHLIVRSSWVYGIGHDDYFSFVAENGKNGTTFDAYTNKISSPTSSEALAEFIVSMIEKSEYGIFHASSEGQCTRYEFAQAILADMGYDVSLAKPVESEKAESTVLENLMMKMTEVYEMGSWEKDLAAYIRSIKEEN